MAKKEWTQEELELLAAYKNRGPMTVDEFCLAHGLTKNQLRRKVEQDKGRYRVRVKNRSSAKRDMREYTDEFRKNAIAAYQNGGPFASINGTAKKLGIPQKTLSNWIKNAEVLVESRGKKPSPSDRQLSLPISLDAPPIVFDVQRESAEADMKKEIELLRASNSRLRTDLELQRTAINGAMRSLYETFQMLSQFKNV